MVPSLSKAKFLGFLDRCGLEVEAAALGDIITAVLDFYNGEHATGLAVTPQADMLLFQFGVYDWGQGEHFQFDITRQFILDGEEGDDAISQLHCTVIYEPTIHLRSIGKGNRWCQSREQLIFFKTFIFSSDAYLAAHQVQRRRVDIGWERV